MGNIFTQFGFSDQSQAFLSPAVNKGLSEVLKENISAYMVGQSISMITTSIAREYYASKSAASAQKHRETLVNLGRAFEQNRHEEEIQFALEHHKKTMDNLLRQNSLMNASRRELDEFRHFCELWGHTFRINIDALLAESANIEKEKPCPNTRIMVARTPLLEGKENSVDFKSNYVDFCDNLHQFIPVDSGLKLDYLGAWKDTCKRFFGEVTSLFYIMQGVPTVVLAPQSQNGRIRIQCAFWGIRQGLGNIRFESLDICASEYNANRDFLKQMLYVASSYLRDGIRSVICQCEPIGINMDLISMPEVKTWTAQKYSELYEIANAGFVFDKKIVNQLEKLKE